MPTTSEQCIPPVASPDWVPPFPGTSFTQAHPNTLLPSPADVRARNIATGHPKATNLNWPPPVRIPELGLFVKYGTQVTRTELEAQLYVYQQLQGLVPAPEVMGWAEDAGQGFIYMELIDAPTLAARWNGLNESEKLSICSQLKSIVQVWRGLEQDLGDVYIGAVGKRPLNDIIVKDRPSLYGPWPGRNAVQAFQEACDIEIQGQIPIVFTHGDLVPGNILVTSGATPRVAAVIDWAQAGWYPAYWEWCKAKWVMMGEEDMDGATQEAWRQRYLPLVVDELPDKTVYYPWFRFALSNC